MYISPVQDHQAAFPPLPLLDTRADLGDVLERENKTVGVELGVQRGTVRLSDCTDVTPALVSGEFAAEVLSRWPKCRKYYLVDLWTHQDNYNDTANVATDAQEAYMNEAKDKLRHWQDKTVWMRMLTSDAAREIPDNSVDFVYIDARHDYCGVSEDLSLYWPKLRVGGIMAGHDYLTDTEMKDIQPHTDWSLCSDGTRHSGAVKKAVSDFVRAPVGTFLLPRNNPTLRQCPAMGVDALFYFAMAILLLAAELKKCSAGGAGLALSFDGVDDFLYVIDSASPSLLDFLAGDYTLEFWYQQRDSQEQPAIALQVIVQQVTLSGARIFVVTNERYQLGALSSNFGFEVYASCAFLEGIENCPQKYVPHHFAFTCAISPPLTKQECTGYLDGNHVFNQTFDNPPFADDQKNPLTFGTHLDVSSKEKKHFNIFSGLIDEVRFWRGCRSEAAIRATQNLTGPAVREWIADGANAALMVNENPLGSPAVVDLYMQLSFDNPDEPMVLRGGGITQSRPEYEGSPFVLTGGKTFVLAREDVLQDLSIPQSLSPSTVDALHFSLPTTQNVLQLQVERRDNGFRQLLSAVNGVMIADRLTYDLNSVWMRAGSQGEETLDGLAMNVSAFGDTVCTTMGNPVQYVVQVKPEQPPVAGGSYAVRLFGNEGYITAPIGWNGHKVCLDGGNVIFQFRMASGKKTLIVNEMRHTLPQHIAFSWALVNKTADVCDEDTLWEIRVYSNGTRLPVSMTDNYVTAHKSMRTAVKPECNSGETLHLPTFGQDWDKGGVSGLKPSDFISGEYSEIRVWKGMRSDEQIAQFWNKRLNGDEEDLYIYYPVTSEHHEFVHLTSRTHPTGTFVIAALMHTDEDLERVPTESTESVLRNYASTGAALDGTLWCVSSASNCKPFQRTGFEVAKSRMHALAGYSLSIEVESSTNRVLPLDALDPDNLSLRPYSPAIDTVTVNITRFPDDMCGALFVNGTQIGTGGATVQIESQQVEFRAATGTSTEECSTVVQYVALDQVGGKSLHEASVEITVLPKGPQLISAQGMDAKSSPEEGVQMHDLLILEFDMATNAPQIESFDAFRRFVDISNTSWGDTSILQMKGVWSTLAESRVLSVEFTQLNETDPPGGNYTRTLRCLAIMQS
ncbi:unnamed protein product [Vitrella brassicaformis CCMP3155]|uniref:LamG-like jellyroll fold domain-containing protein n=2 Tax=Vitrella brassicaformis TaxID=1169539 RepID=A0A0G4EA89_VITBC|nr:unnamed protein product [Vitrella brassicaformis CCMP3155]|eukprot:CEL92384.1 unnamed protein product [Vitrella brassicaformis CCMP3155]